MALLNAIQNEVLYYLGVDAVGVFTSDNFTQVFPEARPLKVRIKEEAKLMEHPVETGAVITDHEIFLPIELELSLIIQAVNYKDVYQTIKQFYLKGTLLAVQTKADLYTNQIIAGLPHEEDPETFDTLVIALKMKEVQFVTPQFGIVPRNKTSMPTVDRGNQQTTAATTDQQDKSSVLFKGFYG